MVTGLKENMTYGSGHASLLTKRKMSGDAVEILISQDQLTIVHKPLCPFGVEESCRSLAIKISRHEILVDVVCVDGTP